MFHHKQGKDRKERASKMKLKENLRYLRKRAGRTQEQLGKKRHVHQYNISDYEIGRIDPNIKTLRKYSEIFDVSIDYIVGNKPHRNKLRGDGVAKEIPAAVVLPEEEAAEEEVKEEK